jgi:hypothetical protein
MSNDRSEVINPLYPSNNGLALVITPEEVMRISRMVYGPQITMMAPAPLAIKAFGICKFNQVI